MDIKTYLKKEKMLGYEFAKKCDINKNVIYAIVTGRKGKY